MSAQKRMGYAYGDPKHQSWIFDEKTGIEHIKFAYEHGINTFATANTYAAQASASATAWRCARENVVHIFDSIKTSLKRLQLDHVDVLQCHRFDCDTPIEETACAMGGAGLVRYVGMSSCHAYQFHQMQNASRDMPPYAPADPPDHAIAHNLPPFISMQNFHNAAYCEEERGMIPTIPDDQGGLTETL
ncbi:arylformamidase [Cryptotrichosporon argae]